MRLGKLQRQFAQMHAASLISSVDTTDVRGHVAKHDIDQLIANQRFQLQQHRVLAEVTDDDLDTGNGIKRQNVERQQLDRKSTRLNSSHYCASRMPPSA